MSHPGYANTEKDEPNDLQFDDGKEDIPKNDKDSAIPDLDEAGSKIWHPYLQLSDKFDHDLVHTWRDDMDLLLLFAALFSASVTAFVIESYKTLLPDSGEVTISVLLQISQQLANATHAPVAVRPTFQTDPGYTLVNIFWFMSLAFSLTCALAAVMVKQWARRYLRFPRTHNSTSDRARARQYVYENMRWWKLEGIVGMMPVLLHISILLFFTGLLLFLHIINNAVAICLSVFSGAGTLMYLWLTIAPLIFPGCPYKTPFSGFLRLGLRGLRIIGVGPSESTRKLATAIWMSNALSAFTQLWSFVLQELYALTRRLYHFLVDDFYRVFLGAPLQGSNVFQALRRSWQKVQAFSASSSRSMLDTTRRTLLHKSTAFAERRQGYANKLTDRDTRALRWVMDYSNRDSDMSAIIKAVPDFVQTNLSRSGVNEVYSVMWDIVPKTIQRLTSTTFTKDPALGLSFLETTIWLTRCSTDVLEKGAELNINLMWEIANIFSREIDMGDNSDLAQFYWLVLSNVVLHMIYKLEKRWGSADAGHQAQIDLSESTRNVVQAVMTLTNYFIRKISIHSRDDTFGHLVSMLHLDILPPLEEGTPILPEDARKICKTLEVFRTHWTMNMLHSQRPFADVRRSHLKLAFPSASDMTTHLQHYPHSSCDSQITIFTLLNDMLANNEQNGKARPTADDLSLVISSYGWVLFGCVVRFTELNRRTLHDDFIDRVIVRAGDDDGRDRIDTLVNVDVTLDVSFRQYCRILSESLSLIKSLNPASRNHGLILDLQVRIIRLFIENRMPQVFECGGDPLVIDATHLGDAREIQQIIEDAGMSETSIYTMITNTAMKFHYDGQLLSTYHIDTHAELQYYDMTESAIFT